MKKMIFGMMLLTASVCLSCEELDDEDLPAEEEKEESGLTKEGMARLLSAMPISVEQVTEVHDAVSRSVGNGYDEEYTMKDLISTPGSGIGDLRMKSAPSMEYAYPLREMMADYIRTSLKAPVSVRSRNSLDPETFEDAVLDGLSPEVFMERLAETDLQIYWPNSDSWDGTTLPVITFDPEVMAETNAGWQVVVGSDGKRRVRRILVDERYASENPVWVLNSNRDAGYPSLEILRKEHPSLGGGSLIIPGKEQRPGTRVKVDNPIRTLILKEIRVFSQFDSWFAGSAEFNFKIGSVENFTASTEAELKLYNPSVTDFMVVVRRKDVGRTIEINTVLVSEWTDKLQNCAFMIVEDDGGKKTNWNCEAIVKYNSKSYGFHVDIPYSQNDDIVWRGQLARRYLDAYETEICRFGEMEVVFEFI